jgi:hypothetical protein
MALEVSDDDWQIYGIYNLKSCVYNKYTEGRHFLQQVAAALKLSQNNHTLIFLHMFTIKDSNLLHMS